MWRVIRFLATLIGIVLLSVFELFPFDWGDRGHDVIIGVWEEVCDAPQTIGFTVCDICSVFPLTHDLFLDELYLDRVLIFPR
jgi:hypothetical protein